MLTKSHRGAFVGGLLALALLLSPLPASAHHGWGGYVDQLSDISGIVESPLSLAGPHASGYLYTPCIPDSQSTW